MYPPDVLPLWVAEMDVPLAEPIVEVLREAVDRGDTGYAFDESFGDAFVEFAQQRYGWSVPTTPVLVGDVMAGAKAALTACTRREIGSCAHHRCIRRFLPRLNNWDCRSSGHR